MTDETQARRSGQSRLVYDKATRSIKAEDTGDVRPIDVKRAAMSIAKMVDEYTQRGWNDEGLANFALIVEKRLRRFSRGVGLQKAPTS